MASRKKFVVWSWHSDDGQPTYVGWGRYGRTHPAKQMWAQRHGVDSDLNRWLCSYCIEPNRQDHSGIVRFYRHEAQIVASGLRDKIKRDGHKLLDPRPYGTKLGGGSARMVMSPEYIVYGSVRQAAAEEGVNPCTITRWCQQEESGWDYIS